jgi:hypothetical protein
MTNSEAQTERIPFKVVAILAAIVGVASLLYFVGSKAFLDTLTIFLGDAGLAAIIILAAGGWGDLLISQWLPKDAPVGLRVVTSCTVGLYLLSMLMLLLGSLGLLFSLLSWGIVGSGVVIMLLRTRTALDAFKLPTQVTSRALVWVVFAIAASIWLAGLARPAGFSQAQNVADLESCVSLHQVVQVPRECLQTLQLPREYFDNERIATLEHNAESYLPQTMEMLSLLGMTLRDNAWGAMYVSKAIHGFMGILAAVAIFTSLPANRFRASAASVLLATTPLVLYASWIASYELTTILCLTLALLWMKRWLAESTWANALPIGLALGIAAGVGYVSVLTVLLPVLFVMIVSALKAPRRFGHIAAVILVAFVLVAPWMLRSTVTTGNPVFPHATGLFGSPEHWSDISDQKWRAVHSIEAEDATPPLDAWPQVVVPTWPARFHAFYEKFVLRESFGPMTLLLAGVALCMLWADRRRQSWDLAIVGVGGMQLALWFAFSPDMPDRHILPIIVPVVLLAGGVIERLEGVSVNPFRKHRDKAPTPWGRTASQIIVSLAVIVNLVVAGQGVRHTQGVRPMAAALASKDLFVGYDLGAEPKLMLVGERNVFYVPAGAIYASPFDTHPLDAMIQEDLTPEATLDRLESLGVTHVWVNWNHMLPLMRYPGFPISLSSDAREKLAPAVRDYASKPVIPALEALKPLGVTELAPTEISPDRDAMRRKYQTVYAMPWAATLDEPAGEVDNPDTEGHHSTQQE